MAHARCRGVLRSLGDTVELTCSQETYARIKMIAFMFELQTASTNCCPSGIVVPGGGKNSLFSYLALIHLSFSSLPDVGPGFVLPWVWASQTELARVFPIASITLKCPAL